MPAPSVAATTSITLSGPFFERDPGQTVRQNIREMLEALVKEGEADVRSDYPVLTGAGRAGVRGRVESISGRRWFLHGVISETHAYPWANGGQKRYLGGKSEARFHMFRRTASRIRSMRAAIGANLSRGIE